MASWLNGTERNVRRILSVLERKGLAEMMVTNSMHNGEVRGKSICCIQNTDISLFRVITKQVFSMKGNQQKKNGIEYNKGKIFHPHIFFTF
ncbi:hypothetical protein [Peribacillus sp. NPDC096540]|uniref:hypothetical protein n=1 Tax=Peribacillus sp. NPDC096540 TaxID=3390612 RepID=UPI003CFD5B49